MRKRDEMTRWKKALSVIFRFLFFDDEGVERKGEEEGDGKR